MKLFKFIKFTGIVRYYVLIVIRPKYQYCSDPCNFVWRLDVCFPCTSLPVGLGQKRNLRRIRRISRKFSFCPVPKGNRIVVSACAVHLAIKRGVDQCLASRSWNLHCKYTLITHHHPRLLHPLDIWLSQATTTVASKYDAPPATVVFFRMQYNTRVHNHVGISRTN